MKTSIINMSIFSRAESWAFCVLHRSVLIVPQQRQKWNHPLSRLKTWTYSVKGTHSENVPHDIFPLKLIRYDVPPPRTLISQAAVAKLLAGIQQSISVASSLRINHLLRITPQITTLLWARNIILLKVDWQGYGLVGR